MLGRRGFFGALAACFAWMLPFKRSEAAVLSAAPVGATDRDDNVVFGCDSGIRAGVKNSVVMGTGSIAKKSNVVMLGNEKTEALIVGVWEFGADESGPYFVNHVTHERYRLRFENPPPSNAAPGYSPFGEHALICGGPECPVGSHRNEALGRNALL
jgi:hypothetical protein